MKVQTYFNKYGKIYGVSYKWNFGRIEGYALEFTDLRKAFEWFNREEYDFRVRELCSKTMAKNITHSEPIPDHKQFKF